MTETVTAQTTGQVEMSNESIIFSAVFKNDEGVARRKQDLLVTFNTPDVFQDEYFVFYSMVKDTPRVVPNEGFLKLYLQTNRAIFQKSDNINLSSYSLGDNDAYVEFANSCIQIFNECSKQQITDEDYLRALEMHKMEYITKKSIEVLEESTVILSEGVQKGRRKLSGYTDMRSNLKWQLQKLDNIVEKKDRKGLIVYGVNDDEEEEMGVKLVTRFGIEALDEAIGGIYEGDMVSLLAPAKGGKSRITTHILHNAIINGTTVAMWSIENGHKGWEALLRARHFQWFYNGKITDASQKKFIDSDMIRKNEMSDELREMEQASWADLKYNSAYGRIVNIDEDCDFDTFEEVLENAINDYGVKLLSLDYPQLISGGNQRMSKAERIAEVYKRLLQLLKKKKVGGIFPAQLKQTVIGDLNKVDPEELVNAELRDAAGESYEVIKTPDVNLMLYGTVEDIKHGDMKLLSIPSRNSSPFDPIDLHVELGTCTFASVKVS